MLRTVNKPKGKKYFLLKLTNLLSPVLNVSNAQKYSRMALMCGCSQCAMTPLRIEHPSSHHLDTFIQNSIFFSLLLQKTPLSFRRLCPLRPALSHTHGKTSSPKRTRTQIKRKLNAGAGAGGSRQFFASLDTGTSYLGLSDGVSSLPLPLYVILSLSRLP